MKVATQFSSGLDECDMNLPTARGRVRCLRNQNNLGGATLTN
jgi:hypothetical protein